MLSTIAIAKLLLQPLNSRAAPELLSRLFLQRNKVSVYQQYTQSPTPLFIEIVNYCSACEFQIGNYFFRLSIAQIIRRTSLRSKEAKGAQIVCSE